MNGGNTSRQPPPTLGLHIAALQTASPAVTNTTPTVAITPASPTELTPTAASPNDTSRTATVSASHGQEKATMSLPDSPETSEAGPSRQTRPTIPEASRQSTFIGGHVKSLRIQELSALELLSIILICAATIVPSSASKPFLLCSVIVILAYRYSVKPAHKPPGPAPSRSTLSTNNDRATVDWM